MLHINYKNLLNSLSLKSKGFWRMEAKAKLNRKIKKGETKYLYLKNILVKDNKYIKNSFLNITSDKETPKKILSKSKSPRTFFMTQIKNEYISERMQKYNKKIFLDLNEELLYSPIELHPFEIKYIRRRDENQRMYNIQELQKEIESNYLKINQEDIINKQRPLTSYFNKNIKSNYKQVNSEHPLSAQRIKILNRNFSDGFEDKIKKDNNYYKKNEEGKEKFELKENIKIKNFFEIKKKDICTNFETNDSKGIIKKNFSGFYKKGKKKDLVRNWSNKNRIFSKGYFDKNSTNENTISRNVNSRNNIDKIV